MLLFEGILMGLLWDFWLDESDGGYRCCFVTTGVGCWAWMDGWHGHVDRYGSRLFVFMGFLVGLHIARR
jgi:hypothetical protein